MTIYKLMPDLYSVDNICFDGATYRRLTKIAIERNESPEELIRTIIEESFFTAFKHRPNQDPG